jgi:hypothetical protein
LDPALLFFGLYAKIATLKQRVDFYSLSFFATQLSLYGVIVWRFFFAARLLCVTDGAAQFITGLSKIIKPF